MANNTDKRAVAGANHQGTKKPGGSRAARQAAAQKKARRKRAMWVGGLIVAGTALVTSIVFGRATGVTDPLAWDLPALGPTAKIQDRVTLADFRGTPTVANFFASWCTECDRELPGFARVSDELRGKVQFVGINSQETGNAMLMPNRHGVDWWPLASDIGGGNGRELSRALGARGMPLTVFYDENGEILHVQLGGISESQLRAFITRFYDISA